MHLPCHAGYGTFRMVAPLALSHAGGGKKKIYLVLMLYLPNADNVYLSCVLFTQ